MLLLSFIHVPDAHASGYKYKTPKVFTNFVNKNIEMFIIQKSSVRNDKFVTESVSSLGRIQMIS